MKDCCSMVSLPESFGHLRSLSQLTIERCRTMMSLPESFGDLRRLSELKIEQCPAMVSLPESFGDLRRLSVLNIGQCSAMVSLPKSFGDLSRLSALNIKQCPTMVSLPESFGDPGKLVQLHTLRINQCHALEWLSQSLVRLTTLVDVHVSQRGQISLSKASGSFLWLSVDEDDREVAHWLFGSTDLRNFIQPIQIQQQKYTAGLLLAAPNININIRRAPQLIDFEFIAAHVINAASRLRNRVSILYLGGLWNVKELTLCNLRHLVHLELRHCYNLQKLPEGLGSLSFLRKLCLEGCLNLEEVESIGNLQRLKVLKIDTCFALKELPSCIGNLSGLEELRVKNCWMMKVIHTQALFSLAQLDVDSCVNVSRIVGLSHLSSLKTLRLRGCVNLRQIMVRFNQLQHVAITGCYLFCDGQLSLEPHPHIFHESYNNAAEDTEVLEWWLNATAEHGGILNVKASPALCLAVEQKMRELLGGEDMSSFFFYKLPPTHVHATHVLSLPFSPHAVLICLISSVYTADLPRHVPPPKTEFKFSTDYKHCYEPQYEPQSDIILYPERNPDCNRKYTGFGALQNFRRFDCGEEIHCAVLPFGIEGDIKSCADDICLNIEKGKLIEKSQRVGDCDMNHCHDPSYEALVKDGWIVYLGSSKVYLAKEIYKIFYSEFRKQRLISCTWTQLPSQLQIHEFSALDIAGCQITKISRHGNTCIMEEESGLIWSKRRCLFMDDHALLLHHPKGSEHSFLAYPEIDHDLERVVANLYEMSISILVNGKVVSSRKLQQIIPIPEEKIPPHTLLQGRDFHSSSEMDRWVKLLQRVKLLLQGRDFYSSSKTKLNLKQWMLKKVKRKRLLYGD